MSWNKFLCLPNITIIFTLLLWPWLNADENVPNYLRIQLKLRNENISLSEAHCNILSIVLLSSGEEIYLKETSGQIIRPQSVSQSNLQEATNIYETTCLYQEMYFNSSRMIVLAASQYKLNADISISGTNYFAKNANLSSALRYLDLFNYSESVDSHGERKYCGVNESHASHGSHSLLDRTAASVAAVDYVNNSITDYYVELYLVVDNFFYAKYGNGTRSYVYRIMNLVNSMFRPLGVHIMLVALDIWDTSNRINVTTNSTETLINLIQYRITLSQKHDVIYLLSGQSFQNATVGLSYVASLCQFPNSAGLAVDDRNLTALRTASIMVHQLGHISGLPSDDPTCSCTPDVVCLMNPVIYTDISPTKWSNCSLNIMYRYIGYINTLRCLEDIPNLSVVSTYSTCGNGVIDTNEDCDPALDSSACCNPSTCRFLPGAECASGRCCNKTTCRPLPAGETCRSATNECDLPEYCNGVSEKCPENRITLDGVPCDNNKGYCYNGYCGSHDAQCRGLMGPTSVSASTCYPFLMTANGLFTGCRYTFKFWDPSSGGTYTVYPCSPSGYYCGRLFCNSYTLDSFFPLPYRANNCFYILYDTNLTNFRDPGMVPNGASCPTNKWCVDSVCQILPTQPSQCSCNGKGVCNDLGHCHCKNGSYGDDCSSCGCGGSVDSGPACSNTTVIVCPPVGATTVSTITTTTAAKTCPSNYCSNGGTCIVNSDGNSCFKGQDYCCRCPGNYLPPNCQLKAATSVQVSLKNEAPFIEEYNDKTSGPFKQFEESTCSLIRASLQNSTDTSAVSCQCAKIERGSSIGTMVLKGSSSLSASASTVVNSITNYCSSSQVSSTPQCNGITASVPKALVDSCATATDCPSSTATCTSIDNINYVCICKTGYTEETKLASETFKVCTGQCVSNVTQCNGNGICVKNRGAAYTCSCSEGYSGQYCDVKGQSSTTSIIIGASVGGGALVLIIVILVIVLICRKRSCNEKPDKDYEGPNVPDRPNHESVYDAISQNTYSNDAYEPIGRNGGRRQ